MCLTVGDVIRWDNFPYPKAGDVKARWFIYLGRTSVLQSPVFAYLCTTTTQIDKFAAGGERANHAYRKFDSKQFSIFETDCILDFDEEIYTVDIAVVERCQHNIETKGKLDVETMRNIYKQFNRPGVLSRITMIDIHESYNRDGIEGLKKPK